MTNNRTEAFWAKPQPNQPTEAYTRPTRPDWRHRTEALIARVRDAYDAVWDVMPAIAAFVVLLWLMSAVPNLHR